MLERNHVRVIDEMKQLLDSFSTEKREQILVILKQVFGELECAAEPTSAAQGA